MKAKKRGKRAGLRARSKNARVTKKVAPQRINVDEREELYRLRVQARRARECMEVNDPANARDIFGPPDIPPPVPQLPSIEELVEKLGSEAAAPPDCARDL